LHSFIVKHYHLLHIVLYFSLHFDHSFISIVFSHFAFCFHESNLQIKHQKNNQKRLLLESSKRSLVFIC